MFSSPLRNSKYKKSYLPKSNLSKQKSKSLFRMDEYSEDYSGSGINLTRETSQVIKKTAKTVFSSAANKIRKVLDSNYRS